MVYETASQGFVIAAALERIIVKSSLRPATSSDECASTSKPEEGKIVHLFYTGCPQCQCLGEMNFPDDVLDKYLSTLNMFHLRSLEQGVDIVAVGNQHELEKKERKKQHQSARLEKGGNDREMDVNNGSNLPPSDQGTENTLSQSIDQESKDEDIYHEQPEGKEISQEVPVPYRQRMRQASAKSYDIIKAKDMDGLIIAAKQHPTNILLYLMKYLAPSRPFIVFSAYKEPLMDAYFAVKETGKAVFVTLSETWLRNHQVLPERTHPEVLMSGGGGYILSGIVVDNSDPPAQADTLTPNLSSSLTRSDCKRSAVNGGNSERKNKRFKRR